MPYPLFVRPVRVPAYSGFPVSVCTNSLIAIFIMQNLRFHTGRLGMILTPWNGFMLVSSERQQRRYMKPPFCFWVCLEQNYLVAKEVWREHFNLKRCRISLNGRLLKWVLPTYTLPFPFVPNMVRYRENAKQAGDVTSWSILTIPEQSSFFIAYKKYEIFEH